MGEAKRRQEREAEIQRKQGAYSAYLDQKLDGAQMQSERQRQLSRISSIRGRSVLVMAADFRKSKLPISIRYEDILPFKDLMEGLDGESVDVILETPGGSAEVAEDLVRLLRQRFASVAFIVPGWAKSAGTIMTMAGDEILMGPASALGPIDAQIQWKDKVFSAEAFLEGLTAMKKEADRKGSLNRAHIPILQQISPGEIQHAENALDFAKKLVADWLERYKFKEWKEHKSSGAPVTPEERKEAATRIAAALCRHQDWLSHGRSIGMKDLRDLGLQITDYSRDADLYDAIRRYHTLVQMTFESSIYKIFETPYGRVYRLHNQLRQARASPAEMKKAAAGAASINADLDCPGCRKQIPMQLNLQRDVPARPGRIPYPSGDLVTCPHCHKEHNLQGLREQLETQIGREVVPV